MRQRAFTIIELLVVVIIIGVLVSIALPKFNSARQKTITREGLSIVSVLVNGVKMRKVESGTVSACSSRTDCQTKLDVKIPNSVSWTAMSASDGAAAVTASVIGKLTYSGSDSTITCDAPTKCGCKIWSAENMTCMQKN